VRSTFYIETGLLDLNRELSECVDWLWLVRSWKVRDYCTSLFGNGTHVFWWIRA